MRAGQCKHVSTVQETTVNNRQNYRKCTNAQQLHVSEVAPIDRQYEQQNEQYEQQNHTPNDQQYDLVCKAHRRHVVGTRVGVVSSDFRNQRCDHKPLRAPLHSKFRQQVFNPSRRQREQPSAGCRISKSLSLPDPVLQTMPRQALLSLDTRGITSKPGQEVTRLQSTCGPAVASVELRLRAG